MEPFDHRLLPRPFGLANLGATCYFNALLQALASCTALTRAILTHGDWMSQTATGRALYEFTRAHAGMGPPPADGASVLSALTGDLRARRPRFRFGHGQESASEALQFLFDMQQPPAADPAAELRLDPDGPLSRLVLHRHRCTVTCGGCRAAVSRMTELAVVNVTFFDEALRPTTPAAFAAALLRKVERVDGYRCEACGATGPSLRAYTLTMVPEIIICAFNQYGRRAAHYYPETFELPAGEGGAYEYALAATVEHAGGLHGGHYWAWALRRFPDSHHCHWCLLNDSAVSGQAEAPTPAPTTYLVFYQLWRWLASAT